MRDQRDNNSNKVTIREIIIHVGEAAVPRCANFFTFLITDNWVFSL